MEADPDEQQAVQVDFKTSPNSVLLLKILRLFCFTGFLIQELTLIFSKFFLILCSLFFNFVF